MKNEELAPVTYTEQVTIPMGQYPAQVKEISAEEGQYGAQYKYVFEISDGDYEGTNLWAWSSQKFSAKSKLKKWAMAATQQTFASGDQFYPSSMAGKPVQIVVLVEQNEDGGEYNKIKSVLAPALGQQKAAQASQATVDSIQEEEPPKELLF